VIGDRAHQCHAEVSTKQIGDHLKIRNATLAVTAIILLGLSAWSQTESSSRKSVEFPRVELAVDYSFARYSPSAAYTQGHSLNGGGGSVQYNINDVIGLKMDLQGYGSNETDFTIPLNVFFPSGGSGKVQGNLFTYMFGPEIKLRAHRFHPFGHILFGAAHSNVYGNAVNQICQQISGTCSFSKAPTGDAFAMAFGGGVDISISKTIAFRPGEVDYLLTRFNNQFTNGNQNNLRYSVGIIFSFGGAIHHY